MNRYHISYKQKQGDTRTQGQNLNAETMQRALTDFETMHKGIEPIYIECKGKVKDQRFG